jgi:hypothetical protein
MYLLLEDSSQGVDDGEGVGLGVYTGGCEYSGAFDDGV